MSAIVVTQTQQWPSHTGGVGSWETPEFLLPTAETLSLQIELFRRYQSLYRQSPGIESNGVATWGTDSSTELAMLVLSQSLTEHSKLVKLQSSHPPKAEPRRKAERKVADLGWTRDQAYAVRQTLASFEDDWNDPGMAIYDDL